jgi:hypothetical protein
MPLRTFRERQADKMARRRLGTDSLFGHPCIARAHACCVDRRGLVGYGPAFLVEPADGTLHALTAHNQVTMRPQVIEGHGALERMERMLRHRCTDEAHLHQRIAEKPPGTAFPIARSTAPVINA